MLTHDTYSACDTLTHNQNLPGILVPELETLFLKQAKRQSVELFLTELLHDKIPDKIENH